MTTELRTLEPALLPAARELLDRACAFDPAAEVAEEKLFAPGALAREAEPLGAFEGERLIAVACSSGRWLRLLAVHPDARGRGVGSALLEACEARIAVRDTSVRVLDQPGNYLSPGVDCRNRDTIEWLERRGYRARGRASNLLLEVQHNPRVSAARWQEECAALRARGYEIERQSQSRIAADAATIAESFSAGWAFEMERAAAANPAGVHIAVHRRSGQLAGFACHDGNNRGLGWFGPTGTLEAHRGQGIGTALLLACLLDVRSAGHSHCQVAWIGPRDFYDKVAGIESERHFTLMSKELHD